MHIIFVIHTLVQILLAVEGLPCLPTVKPKPAHHAVYSYPAEHVTDLQLGCHTRSEDYIVYTSRRASRLVAS